MNNNKKPRLFLFDAYAIIYRAYYAFLNRPLINSKGQNTSAVYGFTNILFDILNRESPDYAAVVFDPPSPTFRNKLYKPYKANRLATPEDIKKSVPVIKEIIKAFNIPILEVEGYEADDVIGTIAKQVEKRSICTYMVTQDKDYMQLVSDTVFLYKPTKESNKYDIVGISEVNSFFEVDNPLKVIDILALWGDASDNVPGAPGIGEKSAKELIAKFGSVEGIFDHIDELKPKQKSSLQTHRDQVILSKELVTICIDVPFDYNMDDLSVTPYHLKKLELLFKELEFRTLATKISGMAKIEPAQQRLFEEMHDENSIQEEKLKTITDVPHDYQVLEEDNKIALLNQVLNTSTEFCFDVETTSLSIDEAELVGLSISFESGKAYYIPFLQEFSVTQKRLNILKPAFENDSILKIGQNLKFDLKILMKYGIKINGQLFDTMIAHYLLMPELRHNLDYLSEIYLKYKMVPIEKLIGNKGTLQKNMRDVDIFVIKEYACEDADITWQLYQKLFPEIQKSQLSDLAGKIEMPLVKVLAEMELAGFNINKEQLYSYSSQLKNELVDLERIIYDYAGMSFNINSPIKLETNKTIK